MSKYLGLLFRSPYLKTALKSGTILVKLTITSEHCSTVRLSILISTCKCLVLSGLSGEVKLISVEKALPLTRSYPAKRKKHFYSTCSLLFEMNWSENRFSLGLFMTGIYPNSDWTYGFWFPGKAVSLLDVRAPQLSPSPPGCPWFYSGYCILLCGRRALERPREPLPLLILPLSPWTFETAFWPNMPLVLLTELTGLSNPS